MNSVQIRKALPYAAPIALSVTFLVSIFCFVIGNHGHRSVFYFHSYDKDSLCTEIRYLPVKPVQGDVGLFVDELLLGPMTNRYKKLFSQGTVREFCFVKENIAYVGLSREALAVTPGTDSIREGVELLRNNIVKNFTYINKIDVFIDGKSVF